MKISTPNVLVEIIDSYFLDASFLSKGEQGIIIKRIINTL